MKIVLYQMRLKILISAYSPYIYNTGITRGDKYNKFRYSLSSDRSPNQNKETSHVFLHVFFWVNPRGLNFHLHKPMKMEQTQ